jgi:hypothetical protein
LDPVVFPARMDLLFQRNDLEGQPVGGHTDSHQTKPLEFADSVGEGLDDGVLDFRWLFNPQAVILRESVDEGWQAWLVVLIIEPLSVLALEGGLQRKGQEIPVGPGLKTDSAHHLVVGGVRLVLQDEIVFEKGEVGKNSEVSLAEMDNDSNLQNGIGIQMD